ncbi:hypothetical protein IWW48_002789 [Coemansia sp. RSA 1200]|nr:hypothetical protein IWW48_002789 [Coemansia sp. RSA 1200]
MDSPKPKAATSTANLRRSVGIIHAETNSSHENTPDSTRLSRTRSQHGSDRPSDNQVPFPKLHAEDEALTTWLIPRVRSMLHDSEAMINTTHRGRKPKGKGNRAWYSSYTTIDWLHDDIREQARLRALRAAAGTKGWWLNHIWDPIQGWVLVVLVGILCGLFAGFISEWSEFLAGWKTGYCRADWRLSKTMCCRESAVSCEYWHTWEPHILPRVFIYICFGTFYTLVAAVMVVKSATRVTVANHGASSSVETKVSPTVKLAYYGAGSGLPEVKSILAGFVIHGFLGVRILLVKTFGLILCCASGIITGKEGPMVQIAASLGNISTRIFDKYYKNEAKKREIISAAAAAGVSVAFGAPIGGVLFSLEEVSYFFPNKTMLRSLACALVAAIVLKAYDPFGTGKLVLFQTTYDMDYHWFEMLAFVIIGVFGGLYGALFCRVNMAVNRLRKNTRLGRYSIIEVIVITMLTLYCSFGNPFTRIGLGELVGSLFQECPAKDPRRPYTSDSDGIEEFLCVSGSQLSDYLPLISLLTFALLNRAFFAAVTFGIKVPSGLVLPSMSVGAIFGRIVGSYMEYLTRANAGSSVFAQCPVDSRCVIPGIYSLVGAGATLTGTTHTTIAVVAILMELTGNLIYTLPVLVGVMTARWVSEYFTPSGIYELLIEHAGHPYFDTKTQYIHTRRTAAELMQTDLETICVDFENENTLVLLSARLSRIAERGLSDGGFPVVSARGHLQGWIACTELDFAISRCHSLNPTTVCFFNNPLWQADYIAHNPASIPHYRMPIAYAKARRNIQKRDNIAVETSANDSQDHATMFFGLRDKLRLLFTTRQADRSRAESLLPASPTTPDNVDNSSRTYQSNGHTVRLNGSDSHSGDSNTSCSGSSNNSGNTQAANKMSPQLMHNNVTIPYFQDRPNDFTPFVDQTPLTISPNTPIELVASLLGRLGISCICVADKGIYCGVIFKKAYIGYAKELEEAGYVH